MTRETIHRRQVRLVVAIIATLTLGLGFALIAPPANALSNPLGELKGGSSDDRVTCSTTAAAIAPTEAPGGPRPKSLTVINKNPTAVYLGGSSVDSTGGASVCDAATDCDYTNSFEFDGVKLWCLTASGSQAVKVIWSY